MKGRPWYASFIVLPRIIRLTSGTLVSQRLGSLLPTLGVLLLLAALLWTINTIAPLAPFIYSLI